MKTLLSILIPPVGVAMKGGSAGQIILNIILCLIGYIPGIIHALIVKDVRPEIIVQSENKPNSVADELEKLHSLKEKGVITEEEFLERKRKLI